MKRTAILASVFAFAMGFVASAADWFNGGIDSAWTNNATGGLWSDSAGGDVKSLAEWDSTSEAIVVDTDEDQQMLFTATEPKALGTSTESVTINSTIKFNAFKADAIPEVPAEAKAGLIVVKEGESEYAYYALVADGSPASNIWAKMTYSGTIDISTPAAVVVQMAKSGEQTVVTYTVDNEALSYNEGSQIPVVADGSVSIAAYSGSGEVKSLTAEATMKTVNLSIDAESLAESNLVVKAVYDITTAGVTNTLTIGEMGLDVVYGTKILIEYAGAPGWAIVGGSAYRERTLTADFEINAEVGDLPVPESVPFMLIIAGETETTNSYATIQEAVDATPADSTATIKLCSDVEAAGPYFWSTAAGDGRTFTLDLGGYTYTLTKGAEQVTGTTWKNYAFGIENKNALTIQNGTIEVAENAPVAELFRVFSNLGLTLEDVYVDGNNLTVQGNYVVQGIYSVGGTVELAGSTVVVVPEEDTAYALTLGKHTTSYETAENMIVVGENVVVTGNVFLAGGTYDEAGTVVGDYYYGVMAQSVFASNNSDLFEAALGESLVLTKGDRTVKGRLYKDMSDAELAFGDAESGTTLAYLKNKELDADYEVPAGKRVEIASEAQMIVASETTLTINGELSLATSIFDCTAETEAAARVLQIPADAEVVLASTGTLTTKSDWGFDMFQNGTMTINAGATINLGATPWVGASAKFNVTSGTVVQTPNDTETLNSGNCYTLAANATATMIGEFPDCLDTYKLNLGAALTATTATKVTALEKIAPVDDLVATHEVVENSGVYSLAEQGGDTPVPEPAEDTPAACSNALVTAGFDADSTVVQKITNKAQIGQFNTFLAKHSVTAPATDMTAAQRQFAYDSYVLDSVLTDGVLFSTQPILKATAVTIDGSNLSLAVNLSAEGVDAAAIKLIAANLAECLRTGTSLSNVASWTKPTVTVAGGDGTATVTFTIEKSGDNGFYRSVVADPAAN